MQSHNHSRHQHLWYHECKTIAFCWKLYQRIRKKRIKTSCIKRNIPWCFKQSGDILFTPNTNIHYEVKNINTNLLISKRPSEFAPAGLSCFNPIPFFSLNNPISLNSYALLLTSSGYSNTLDDNIYIQSGNLNPSNDILKASNLQKRIMNVHLTKSSGNLNPSSGRKKPSSVHLSPSSDLENKY